MKKSLIALAVASAMAAPMAAQADATLYGVAQFRLKQASGAQLEAQMAKTRLGVKGTVDNDLAGVETGYQFEFWFDGNGTANNQSNNVDVRLANAYMSGNFGTFTFGRQNNPAAATKVTDILGSDSSALGYDNFNFRIGSSVSYTTPDLNGFKAFAGLVADSGANDADNDHTIFGGTVSAGNVGLTAAVQTNAETTNNAGNGSSATGFAATYAANNLYLAAEYHTVSFDNQAEDETYYALATSYSMDKVSVSAQVESVSDKEGTAGSNQGKWMVGAYYALGGAANVGLEYADYDDGAETAGMADQVVFQYTLSF